MTIGIYALSFNDYEQIYIGQSVNIDLRIGKHLSMLKHNKHYNNITNIKEFAKLHNLNHSRLCQLLNKRKGYNSVSGWTLV